jgi:hypothetical protein
VAVAGTGKRGARYSYVVDFNRRGGMTGGFQERPTPAYLPLDDLPEEVRLAARMIWEQEHKQ